MLLSRIVLRHKLQRISKLFLSSLAQSEGNSAESLAVVIKNGCPVVSIPLPSRREFCAFTLKPLNDNVDDFIQYICNEDKGIDRVSFFNHDGQRISKNTSIGDLFLQNFKIVINDVQYNVDVSDGLSAAVNGNNFSDNLSDVKTQVWRLYTALNVGAHYEMQRQSMSKQLELLRAEIHPLQETKAQLDRQARKRTTTLKYVGLASMGLQMGIFARLTWWEYSWDIMEPVTYFATFSTLIAMYGYFICTDQQYEYTDIFNRQHLLGLHRGAKRKQFDISKYNKLCDEIARIELDLARLRDPLNLTPPIEPAATTSAST